MNFAESLTIQSLRWPDKIAIKTESRNTTYKVLNSNVNSLSHGLHSLGIKKGDMICQLQGNTIEHFELLYAIGKIGAIRIPLDPRGNLVEWKNILENFKPSALVYDNAFASSVRQLQADLGQHMHYIEVSRNPSKNAISYEDLTANFSKEEPEAEVCGKDPYIIQSTSGSMGIPKAVLLTHEATILRVLMRAVDLGNHLNGVYLAVTSLANTASTFFGLSQLFLGGTVILRDKFDPHKFLKTIEEEKVTNSSLVPVMGERLLEVKEITRYDLSSLQFLLVYGAPLHKKTRESLIRFVTPKIVETYGITETGPITNLMPHDQLKKMDSVGQPTTLTKIKIMDDRGEILSPGEVGEILVKTPYLFKEYLNNPKKTKQNFRNGWFHTGDLGKLDEDGYLYVIGRRANMTISGGYNIYEEEVEQVIAEHPKVKEVAVIGVPDETWGEAVKAVVVLKPNTQATEEEIKEFCKQKLPSYKKPRSVDFSAGLPRFSSGKLAKQKLRDKYWKGLKKKVS